MQELRDLCHVKDLTAAIVQLESGLRKEIGLNLNQSFALCCLARGPLNAGSLADELRIHGASLSRIIKTLYSKGYIYRDLNWGDSRQKVLALTEEGQKVALALAGFESRTFPLAVEGKELAGNR